MGQSKTSYVPDEFYASYTDNEHERLVELARQKAINEGDQISTETGFRYVVDVVNNVTKTYVNLYVVDGSTPRTVRLVERVFAEV